MNDFEAYYWRISDLATVNVTAGERLRRDEYAADTLAAFESLLHSDDVVARGIALDHISYAQTQGRLSVANPFAALIGQALESARTELNHPAVTSTSPRGSTVVGANHASALGVLSHYGDARDLDAISRFLEPSQDLNVLEEACMAVDHCIPEATSATRHAIGVRLAAIFCATHLAEEVRIMAISSFLDDPSLNQDDSLFNILNSNTMPLSAYAAWALIDRNLDNPGLHQIVAGWPEDAPYPAGEVRDELRARR